MRFILSFLLIALTFASASQADDLKKIEIGYMPNLWWAQPYVIKGMGWDHEVGLDIALERYPGPPTQAQAFASGKMDMAYNNVGTTLTLAQQRDIKIIASSIKGDIFLAGRGRLVEFRKTLPPHEAIIKLSNEENRKVKISTNPKGTLSDLVLRYWLENAFEDYKQYVKVINTGSQDQFQHSIISGDVDAAAVFQPLWTVSKHKAPELEIFAEPHELMQDQPGGVLFVRQKFWDEHSDAVEKYMALHILATKFIKENPKEASKHIHNYISLGLVPIEITEEAVEFTTDRFADNPQIMVSPTKVIQELMIRDGYLRKNIDIDGLYETGLYDAAIKPVD